MVSETEIRPLLLMFIRIVPLEPTNTPLYIPKLLLSNCESASGTAAEESLNEM